MGTINSHIESQKNDKRLLRIVDPVYNLSIKAPMPETYTLGVGSEIGSPFASFASDGTASALITSATGASQKIGITTRKLFQGTDQPDITVELKFVAYTDAYLDVVVPIVKLLLMATGEERDLVEDLGIKGSELIVNMERAANLTIGNISALTGAKRESTDNLINYLRAPSTAKIIFGELFVIPNAYLSNVSVSFSNVMDSDYLPMEATASVTITPQDPFTKNAVVDMFKKRISYEDRK